MSIREMLNRNAATAKAVALALCVLGVGAIGYQAMSAGPAERPVTDEAFFTVDEGATWFADEADKLSGFEHEGKPAYRAHVYRPVGGEPFVGYIERLTPEARSKLEGLSPNPKDRDQSAVNAILLTGREIKKPGDTRWLKATDPGVSKVLDIRAPDGSTDLEPVHP